MRFKAGLASERSPKCHQAKIAKVRVRKRNEYCLGTLNEFLMGRNRSIPNPGQSHFLESILLVYEKSQIPFHPKGVQQKLKSVCGLVLSETYIFVLFSLIYGLDQIKSDGFRCRNLKEGAKFLLSEDTEPADYLNATFAQIYERRKENGKGIEWGRVRNC